MAFRKINAKRYNGILEYYNPKSQDKETRALYLTYRDVSGKSVKKKLETLNRDEAKSILDSIKNEIATQKSVLSNEERRKLSNSINNKITLDELAEWYFAQRQAVDNVKDRKAYFNRVSPHIGQKLACKITTDDIISVQQALKEKYAPKTTNETINSLRALYNRAIKKEKIRCSNPVVIGSDDVQRLEQNREPGRILTDEELEKLFNTFKNGDYDLGIKPRPNLYLFAKLLYHTGARPSGLIEIRVKHCNFNENTITIKAMKKGRSYQAHVRADVMQFIKEWIEEHKLGFNDCIFYPQRTFERTGSGKDTFTHYAVFRKSAQSVFEALFNKGIPTTELMHRVSFYSLRRTAGTKVYKAKGIMQAMVFLNHTSVKTTQIYLNVSGDMKGVADVL